MNIEEHLGYGKMRDLVWDQYTKIVYRLEKNDRYYLRLDDGDWVSYSLRDLRSLLESKGLFGWIVENDPKNRKMIMDSFWRDFKNHVLNHNTVKGVGRIGGRFEGIQTTEYGKFLIEGSPIIIQPKEGDWPFIQSFLTQLLPDGQLDYFLAWLQKTYTHLLRREFSYGQALFFIGPRQCGKSLLQVRLITPILGGRYADPFTHMTGESRFNSDLLAADHLIIEDKGNGWRSFNRIKFADAIKEITVNRGRRFEAKGQDAYMVKARQRITISVNEESHNFEMIPCLEDSIEDKIMLFRCHPVNFGCGPIEIESKIAAELPAFLHYLITWNPPPFVISENPHDRFGIKSYFDAKYRQFVNELSPEELLGQVLQIWLDSDGLDEVEGTAIRIWNGLTNCQGTSHQLNRVAGDPRSLGRKLGKLARTRPEEVIFLHHSRDGYVYRIRQSKEENLFDMGANGA
jgi:hypothetical protein